MAEKWDVFVILVGMNMNNATSPIYPIYRLLIDQFPVEFMLKLLSTIISGASQVVQGHAAALLRRHFRDILEERYSSMDTKTRESFQSHVVLLLDFEPLHICECAVEMTATLLTLSLHFGMEWTEFLKLTEDAFILGTKDLDSILDIFCRQNVVLQYKFISLLEPRFRKETKYFSVLLELLGKGKDYKPFMILPSISHMLERDIWSVLMEGAILSPFFDSTDDPLRKCQVASALRFCIQHSSFSYSFAMINKIKSIIFLLMQSGHDGEKRMGTKLCGALLASCFQESMR